MNDEKLKAALAKMLSENLAFIHDLLFWTKYGFRVLDTELLHLCALVEKTLTESEYFVYRGHIAKVQDAKQDGWFSQQCLSATWQQRVTALAKVKGIEV